MNTVLASMVWLTGVGLGFTAVLYRPYAALPDGWRRVLSPRLGKTVGRILVGALVGIGPHLLLAVPYPTMANSIDFLRYAAGGATFGVLAAAGALVGWTVGSWTIAATTWLYRAARKRVAR
jgi:hypothetical protein